MSQRPVVVRPAPVARVGAMITLALCSARIGSNGGGT